MTTITITENFDITSVNCINKKYITPEEGKTIENMRKKISKNGTNEVQYKYDKNNTKRLSAKTPSIQFLNKFLRSYLCNGNYIDCDMECCSLNIISGLIKKHNIEDCCGLMNDLKLVKKMLDAKTFNAFIFGNQSLAILDTSKQVLFKKIRRELVDLEKKNKADISDGTALSHIIFYYEYIIMSNAINYFDKEDIKYSTIIFDGIHLKNITEEQLKDLQKYILDETKHFDIPWKIKPYSDLPDDFIVEDADDQSECSNDSKKENINDIIYEAFIIWANENHLIRLKDTTITLKKIAKYNTEVVYNNFRDLINGFILSKSNQNLFKGAGIKSKRGNLMEFLETNQPDTAFPVKEKSWEYIGYSNGVYCVSKNKFYDFKQFAEIDLDNSILVRKYFDTEFPSTFKIPDLIQKNIFDYQGFTPDTCKNIISLLGRLFFPINYRDSWGVALNLYGTSSSGKGTLVDCIMEGMNNSKIKTFGSRKDFGLSNKNNKELLYHAEAEYLFDKIDEEDFKKMCRGELTETESKGKDTCSEIWNTPMIFTAQGNIKVKDKSDAMSNRLINIEYSKKVEIIENFKNDCVKLAPSFIPYCIQQYFNTDKLIISDQIKTWSADIKEEENIFKNWLSTPKEDLYYQVIFCKDNYTSFKDLDKAFKNHCKFTLDMRNNIPKIGLQERAELGQIGGIYETIQICKSCNKKAVSGCCDNYNPANRVKHKKFKHIKIVKPSEDREDRGNDSEEVG